MFKWTAPQKKEIPSPETPGRVGASVEFQAGIVRIRTMADGGLRVELDMPESQPELIALLYALLNKSIKVTINDIP